MPRTSEQDEPTAIGVNVRLTIEQYEYLREVQNDLGTTLSAAVRRVIDNGRLLEQVKRAGDHENSPDSGIVHLGPDGEPLTDPEAIAAAHRAWLLTLTPVDELQDDQS